MPGWHLLYTSLFNRTPYNEFHLFAIDIDVALFVLCAPGDI